MTPGFPPDRGGVEEHAHHLAVRLAAEGDRVGVLTASRAGPVGPAQRPDGISVHAYRAWPIASMSISPRLTLAGLRVRPFRAEITHVHSYHATSGFAAVGGFRRPVVFTPHYHGSGHTPAARAMHLGYRLAGRAMFAAADAIICVSEAERAAVVADFPGCADRVRVIPNGVDRTAIRSADPFPDQPPTALVVGRLEPYKQVDVVIRAFADLPSPAQLVVVGTGSESTSLLRLIDDLGAADRIRLLGGVDTGRLHRWLRTARVLVSLSEHEAFGMVPLEAATAGARVVLSDIPAHREITGKWLGSAGELVSADNPAVVTDALARALSTERRVTVDVPDWADVARATRAVYRDVLDARTRSASPPLVREWSTP